jgi:trans-aconitate methyltransferase
MAYSLSARVYDALYEFKDYAREAGQIHDLIRQYSRGTSTTLLDVAAGTGKHLAQLRRFYAVEGLDESPDMLAAARQSLPDVRLHEASMVDFQLDNTFDVITCLFSSIGYVLTVDALNQTLMTFAHHLNAGGLAIVEPWLLPDTYREGSIHATFVDKPDIKISRMVRSERDGSVSVMAMHHLVVTTQAGVEYFVETHNMRLFTHDEYMHAIKQAGLRPVYLEQGLTGRGLYIGSHA